MPKRKQPEILDISGESNPRDQSPDEEEEMAEKLIAAQKEQQNKRRSKSRNPRARVLTSLWTTHAAQRVDGDKPMFLCHVCDGDISTNMTFSSSNITLHYNKYHTETYEALQRLNKQNATDDILSSAIGAAREAQKNKNASIGQMDRFFLSKGIGSTASRSVPSTPEVSAKLLRGVSLVLYSCVTETSPGVVYSPLTQALIIIFNGRMQYSSKDATDAYLQPTHRAVCELLRTTATSALTGSLTLDGWSAALGAPILGITWHFVDDSWRLRSIPLTMLNTGTAPKAAEQLRSIVDCVLKHSTIIGSDKISIHTITSDNEPSFALGVRLLTNYVGSVRFVVHTLALCVNDVFGNGVPGQKNVDVVNNVTKYFNYHGEASALLTEKQLQSGVTADRLQRLKHDIPTRWHSTLGAMLTYISRFDNEYEVAKELRIDAKELTSMMNKELKTLAEIIYALAEVRRFARQLEEDRSVTMSRAPRLLQELYETLLVMSGKMIESDDCFFDDSSDDSELDTSVGASIGSILTTSSIPSFAEHCQQRDEARSQKISKRVARDLAEALEGRVSERLGFIWKTIDAKIATWRPSDTDDLHADLHASRRVLPFHIAAFLDVKECTLEFLQCSRGERTQYYKILCAAVARETTELECDVSFSGDELSFMIWMLSKQMRSCLRKCGRRAPNFALQYWKDCNEKQSAISPVVFNKTSKALFSSQASSASAERLFSDLGILEGRERQSLQSSGLEMTETIRHYVNMTLKDTDALQTDLLHPAGVAFKRTCLKVASKVAIMQ